MGRTIRRRWWEIMERFIRLNRSILDCDLAKGGWRLDEEGIAAIEDEVAELVRIIAQSHRGDIPRESAAFAEFRRTRPTVGMTDALCLDALCPYCIQYGR